MTYPRQYVKNWIVHHPNCWCLLFALRPVYVGQCVEISNHTLWNCKFVQPSIRIKLLNIKSFCCCFWCAKLQAYRKFILGIDEFVNLSHASYYHCWRTKFCFIFSILFPQIHSTELYILSIDIKIKYFLWNIAWFMGKRRREGQSHEK